MVHNAINVDDRGQSKSRRKMVFATALKERERKEKRKRTERLKEKQKRPNQSTPWVEISCYTLHACQVKLPTFTSKLRELSQQETIK
jgi:hypothetical protein